MSWARHCETIRTVHEQSARQALPKRTIRFPVTGRFDPSRQLRPARPGVCRLEMSMSGTQRSSAGLTDRQRRLLFRCWHRGMREMDLIMGRFADAEIDRLTEAELDDLERLIEVPDRDVFMWITDEAPVPDNYATPVFQRLKGFHVG
jgi:antitoxin CptB